MQSSLAKIVAVGLLIMAVAYALRPEVSSRLVMTLSSWQMEKDSVTAKAGLTLEFHEERVPLQWFRPMCLYNERQLPYKALGFDQEGTADVSIYYTFGSFNGRHSAVYDVDSPYYSAFYGAYAVDLKGLENQYALSDVELRLAEALTRYDYTVLILSGLGCEANPIPFRLEKVGRPEQLILPSAGTFTKAQAEIQTLGMAHRSREFLSHDLQFGRLDKLAGQRDFEPIRLFGRSYSQYRADEKIFIIFYGVASSEHMIDTIDSQYLQNVEIVKKK